jgi:hypothetical protein
VSLNAGTNTIEISHSWGYTAFDYITIGGSGTTTPPPTGGTETRPTYNTGTGFFMKNAKIYDANGNEFIPIGTNGPTFWQDETCGKASFDDMARAGANAVRITSVTPTNNSWSWSSRIENQRAMVASAVANKLVPMLEMHDATCGWKYENDPQGAQYNLKPIVDYWVSPGMVQLCKDYERQLIVNIANEWGGTDYLFDWKEGYKTAISRMRAAGIKNMLVIDAGRQLRPVPQRHPPVRHRDHQQRPRAERGVLHPHVRPVVLGQHQRGLLAAPGGSQTPGVQEQQHPDDGGRIRLGRHHRRALRPPRGDVQDG